MSAHIETYAMVGNCFTAALVGLDGSVDWLCLPNFGSGACFAALLGTPENGRWQVAPAGPYTAARRYRGDTMILETTFTTAEAGVATVVDFMPRPDDGDLSRVNLVRIVRPVTGTVSLRSDVAFRFDYGHVKPWVQRYEGGVRAVAGPDAVVLRTLVPLHGEGFRTRRRRHRDRGRRRRDVRADLLRQPPAARRRSRTCRRWSGTASGSGPTGRAGTPPTTRTGTRSCGRCWR